MSTINRLAPYAYLAKRGGNNDLYDLYLLVPVDGSGDTDLSEVSVKELTETRLGIDYATTNTAANVPYRFKHIEIDKGKDVLDILIQGDNDPDRMIVLTFDDADTQEKTSTTDSHTCAPYVSTWVEVSGAEAFVHMSCIVLFEGNIGIQSESIIFAPNSCRPTIALGNSNVTTEPEDFVINQDLKAVLTANQLYEFEVEVAGNSSLNKPPRKNKTANIHNI